MKQEELYKELGELDELELLNKICIEIEFLCNVYKVSHKGLLKHLKKLHKKLKNNRLV